VARPVQQRPHNQSPEPRCQTIPSMGDAVEKTTYVTGSGTEPETIKPAGVEARVPSGGGQNATWIIIGLLAVGAVLVYLLGFGR
jgi:hypothetical protein